MLPLYDSIPHRRPPYINYGIVFTCVGVFLYQLLHPHFTEAAAFRPAFLFARESGLAPAQVATSALASMFMHANWLHLGSNMWFLWVFGDNVEDRLGSLRYLLFYLLCGFLATGAHVAITLLGASVTGPENLAIPMVGASGAIAGVMGAYLKLFPESRILALVPFFFLFLTEIPAFVFIVVWFVLQLLMGLANLGGGPGVAFWAHVGGFVAGMLMVAWFTPVRRRPRPPRVLDIRFE